MFKGVDKETIFQWTVEILNKFIDRLLIRELMNARGVIQKSATLRGCKESHFNIWYAHHWPRCKLHIDPACSVSGS